MTAAPHPKAVAMTTPEARRGRSPVESLAMRFPGLIRRLAELVLMRRGVPGRDALIRWAYRTAYAAYNRRDWESNTLLIYADDYVLRAGGMRRLMPDAEDEYHGVEGYLEATSQWAGAWDGMRVEFDDLIEVEPGLNVSLIRFSGLARGSDFKFDQAGADVHRFRRGRLVSQTFYFDRDAGLESVGLRAPDSRR
jgi:hypothetical protein